MNTQAKLVIPYQVNPWSFRPVNLRKQQQIESLVRRSVAATAAG
jgi:hypothetical protein